MKLSPRQRQIAVLKQRGATNKEIAIVLGIGEESVKSQYTLMRRKCMAEGVDIFAVPIEPKARREFFANLARVEYYKIRFGEQIDNSSRDQKEAPTARSDFEGHRQTATDHNTGSHRNGA